MSLVLSASSNVWFKKKMPIQAGQTVVIDSLPAATTTRAHYKISFTNGTNFREFDFDLRKDSSGFVDTVTGKTGSGLSYSIESAVSGSQIEVRLENNEAFDFSLSFARILIDA